ncbi:MAG: GntR family transcriptional regulator [Trueperaceae bacterium]|nr:GntR family transcriptional regulator [Trueperaceae bacterium]
MTSHTGKHTTKRKNLTEHIVSVLTERIIQGTYPPGAPLREIEIADDLGVSRSPLREALRVLSQQGLVEIAPGKGARVAPLTVRAAGEFYDVRAVLEAYCTRLAVEVCSDEQLAQLMEAFANLEKAAAEGNIKDFQSQNTDFHLLLYSFCQNKTLVSLVDTFWKRGARYSRLLRLDSGRSTGILERKRELVRLIWSRDAYGAAECVRGIILSGKVQVAAVIAAGVPFTYGERAKTRQRVSEAGLTK